ncbi:MAG: FtsW/RodA/SpoVE family cell cycle protein, partial [Gemmiger sp.]
PKGGTGMLRLLRRYARRADLPYLVMCMLCSALSVVVLISIGQSQLGGSNNKASVQLIASLLGVMLAIIVSTIDYRALARAWPLHAVVAWGLVLPTLFLHNFKAGFVTIGYDAGGTANYSWYRVGGMTFQPSELAKISFVLTFALHLDKVRGRVNRPLTLLGLLVHMLLPALLIHIQGDDGTALVFLGIGVIMLYAGGLSHWLVGGALAAAVGGGALLLKLKPGILKGYQFKRILAVLHPDDPTLSDFTYQQNKGAMAIGTGGLTGQGLSGEHIFVPNAWNDFIFSYLANALGFVGSVLTLALLLGIMLRTLQTALRSTDALGRYLCTGIFAALFIQCVINLGMNLQILPVIGITLPFFSAGGSSVVMMYLCVGLVMSVSMRTRRTRLKAQPVD